MSAPIELEPMRRAMEALEHLANTLPECTLEQVPLAAGYARMEAQRLAAAIVLLTPTIGGSA
jgi:hypothetical protein